MKILNLEYLVPGIYLAFLLYLGFARGKDKGDRNQYLIGGRRLTLPAFVATLVTTWYGGILGVGEFTYYYGLSNWVVFGAPYYLFAILYALFLAPKIRQNEGLTIPDQLASQYGPWAGKISAIWTFFMTLPAPYVLMVGLLLSWMTHWPLSLCIILGTAFSMLYVAFGGFNAVVRTDKFQFLLMFGGFIYLLSVLVSRFGGLSFLQANLPASHWAPMGGNSWSFILVWYLIALWTFVDPGFHQRCAAAETPQTARKGIFVSIVFWLIFDFLTTTVGLYARSILPDLENPVLSFPVLAHQTLSPLFSGLFLTALLATIMSTIDSFSFLSAISLGHDFLGRMTKGPRSSTSLIRISLGVTAVFSILLAIGVPSVIQLWFVIGTLFIPPLLLPLLASYFPALKVTSKLMIANLVFGFLWPLAWFLVALFRSADPLNPSYPFGIQPMFTGLAWSGLVLVWGHLRASRRSTKDGQGSITKTI